MSVQNINSTNSNPCTNFREVSKNSDIINNIAQYLDVSETRINMALGNKNFSNIVFKGFLPVSLFHYYFRKILDDPTIDPEEMKFGPPHLNQIRMISRFFETKIRTKAIDKSLFLIRYSKVMNSNLFQLLTKGILFFERGRELYGYKKSDQNFEWLKKTSEEFNKYCDKILHGYPPNKIEKITNPSCFNYLLNEGFDAQGEFANLFYYDVRSRPESLRREGINWFLPKNIDELCDNIGLNHSIFKSNLRVELIQDADEFDDQEAFEAAQKFYDITKYDSEDKKQRDILLFYLIKNLFAAKNNFRIEDSGLWQKLYKHLKFLYETSDEQINRQNASFIRWRLFRLLTDEAKVIIFTQLHTLHEEDPIMCEEIACELATHLWFKQGMTKMSWEPRLSDFLKRINFAKITNRNFIMNVLKRAPQLVHFLDNNLNNDLADDQMCMMQIAELLANYSFGFNSFYTFLSMRLKKDPEIILLALKSVYFIL